jgi:hypothetical protein
MIPSHELSGVRYGVAEPSDLDEMAALLGAVFRKLGFAERVRRSYRDYAFQGEAVFASIRGHDGPILMDKDLG